MVYRDVWAFYESLGEGDRAHLTDRERDVAAICDFRQELNSGGFDSYFSYWGGDTAKIALPALERILGAEWASLLDEAMQLLGADYPELADLREPLLVDAVCVSLDVLDRRFYELESGPEADVLLSQFLSSGTV